MLSYWPVNKNKMWSLEVLLHDREDLYIYVLWRTVQGCHSNRSVWEVFVTDCLSGCQISISIWTSNFSPTHIIKWKQSLFLNHIWTTFSLKVSHKPTVWTGPDNVHDHKLPFFLSCLWKSLCCKTKVHVSRGELRFSICTDPETWVHLVV